MNIRQARVHEQIVVAKPVLLQAIIDGIDEQVFTNNRFVLNEWLEGWYCMLMSKYVRFSQFVGMTEIEKPF